MFSALVKSVSEDQDRLLEHGFLSDSFANISAEYMPDLQRGLDSDPMYKDKLYPTSGATSHIRMYDATRFLYAVSRNKEGYDRLNVSQHVYAAALMEAQAKHPGAYPQSTDATIDKLAYQTGLFQGIIANGQKFQADKDNADANARDSAWKDKASLWGGSLVGSTVSVAAAPFTGTAGVYAGGLAGTAAGEIFNGILDGFDGDGSQEKEQVYHNVRRMDQLQNSASLTTEQSVKAATGDDAAASRSGDRAGLGFSDADALIDNSNAEM